MKITIREAWTYRTPQVTIPYGPGEYDVSPEIAAAFAKENGDGDEGPATAGPARGAGKA